MQKLSKQFQVLGTVGQVREGCPRFNVGYKISLDTVTNSPTPNHSLLHLLRYQLLPPDRRQITSQVTKCCGSAGLSVAVATDFGRVHHRITLRRTSLWGITVFLCTVKH